MLADPWISHQGIRVCQSVAFARIDKCRNASIFICRPAILASCPEFASRHGLVPRLTETRGIVRSDGILAGFMKAPSFLRIFPCRKIHDRSGATAFAKIPLQNNLLYAINKIFFQKFLDGYAEFC